MVMSARAEQKTRRRGKEEKERLKRQDSFLLHTTNFLFRVWAWLITFLYSFCWHGSNGGIVFFKTLILFGLLFSFIFFTTSRLEVDCLF
ncbi:hypothetical protein QBC38DRAFT_41562 [Podospora fimiseda]|uniref:Uncharacterized protein n=1 Tax=Podospora fimiseda TaxID=252190 RepID=A0AAN7H2R9_9PEZI|nr:hypothetical protein QBC38DRAFT_41562 [Podospora fimiseda]